MRGLRSGQDLVCGLLFASIGALGLWVGWDYPMGTRVRLGSGVFPHLLSWGLIVIGAIVFVRALLTHGKPLGGIAWRPVFLVTLAIVAFGMLIEPAGLVAAMLALMVLGALGGDEHHWKEFSIFSAIMLVLGVGTFIWGLGLPLKAFPWN
jgi:putative tricarboxylic transport membrane protein